MSNGANMTTPSASSVNKMSPAAEYSAVAHEESFMERWLIMPKVLYFLLNMFVYTFHALMPVFFQELWHFKYYSYGFASSIIATNFFGAMIWSSLADKTGRYKSIIVVTSVLYTIVALALLVPVFKTQPVLQAIYVFVGLGLFNFFLSCSFPLLDAQILGMMATNPRVSKEQFGFQRMFGAFGHLAATMLSLILYEQAGKNSWNGIAYKSIVQAALQIAISVVFILAVWLAVPDVKPVKGGHHGHHGGNGDKKGGEAAAAVRHPVVKLMTCPNYLFFMLFVMFSGIVRAVSTNFQKPIAYAISDGKGSKTSYIDIARVFSEVFVYATAKHMRQAMGVYWVLVFSQLTGIARLWGYGLIDTKSSYAYFICWPLELLKGFNSGLISSSAIIIASNLAPAGCESTAQGLYSGMYSGLSMAVGGIVSGVILMMLYRKPAETDADGTPRSKADIVKEDMANQTEDVQRMFNWVSIASLIVTIVLCLKYIFIDRVMGIPGFPRRRSSPGAHH